MKTIKYLPTIIVFWVFMSCTKTEKEECSTDISNIKSIETVYNCTYTPVNMQLNINNEYKIITNSVDYDNFVIGSCHPAIDFSQYNLVIGTIYSDIKIYDIRYKLYKTCEANNYKLNIGYKADSTQAGNSFYTYHILLSKQENMAVLKVTYFVD